MRPSRLKSSAAVTLPVSYLDLVPTFTARICRHNVIDNASQKQNHSSGDQGDTGLLSGSRLEDVRVGGACGRETKRVQEPDSPQGAGKRACT